MICQFSDLAPFSSKTLVTLPYVDKMYHIFLFSPKVRPLSVEIHSLAVSSAKSEGDNLMFSGHNESWTCIAYGSYPSPSVSWWIDDRFKLDHHEEVRTYRLDHTG